MLQQEVGMTRFTIDHKISVGDKTLVVKHMPGREDRLATLTQFASFALSDAKLWVRMAITALQQKNSNSLVLFYANRYFLTNRNRIDPSRLSYIMAIYELVAGGLNSDVTLKIGSNIGKRDKDPLGAVRTRYT